MCLIIFAKRSSRSLFDKGYSSSLYVYKGGVKVEERGLVQDNFLRLPVLITEVFGNCIQILRLASEPWGR